MVKLSVRASGSMVERIKEEYETVEDESGTEKESFKVEVALSPSTAEPSALLPLEKLGASGRVSGKINAVTVSGSLYSLLSYSRRGDGLEFAVLNLDAAGGYSDDAMARCEQQQGEP